jgi:fatty acid desaturase
LSKDQLYALSRVNSFVSTCHILLEWTLVVLAAILCQHYWNPLLYVATVAFIGARQHALLILMHDGTHYRLFRNRYLNDWVSEMLLAWPHLVTMRSYRENHLAHHNYVNTAKDPDWLRKKDNPEWHFPQTVSSLVAIFVRDLVGIGGINLMRLASTLSSSAAVPSKAFVRTRLAFYLIVLGTLITAAGGKALVLYWIVPYFTWLILIMRIRSIAEHFAIAEKPDVYRQTRTTYAGVLARLFIAPKNVNYHIEHHFFPSVPFFRLPKLHALLMSNEEFAGAAHITQSYARLLLECLRRADASDSAADGLRIQPAASAVAGALEMSRTGTSREDSKRQSLSRSPFSLLSARRLQSICRRPAGQWGRSPGFTTGDSKRQELKSRPATGA